MTRATLSQPLKVGLVLSLAYALAATIMPPSAMAQAGGTISNGSQNFLSTELFFEPEVGFVSLKKQPPTWNEVEQLLDNPYRITTGSSCNDTGGAVPGNDTGFPTYCTNGGFVRRLTFGVTLPRILVHPLNYNPATGQEMRLLNPRFAGGNFLASGGTSTLTYRGICYGTATEVCTPSPLTISVSSGASRMCEGGECETEIDYADGIGRRLFFCLANPEPVPLATPLDPSTTLQDVVVCGADPGEPGAFPHLNTNLPDNLGLPSNAVNNTTWYSTPAVPAANTVAGAVLNLTPGGESIPTTNPSIFGAGRLVDPARGVIQPRDQQGNGGLLKPSLRIPDVGGSNPQPNFLYNSDDNLAARGGVAAHSNENDYLRGGATGSTPKENARRLAMVLGKALFWDMQVGSDSVQACGSCHAHAGADNRTKNQMNPNDIGVPLDLNFEVGQSSPTAQGANHDLVASDFPFVRLTDPEIAGDPLCNPPIVADVTGIQFPDGDPPSHPLTNPTPTVCAASNRTGFSNDAASSQGVHFGRFFDIPTPGPGAFGPPSTVGAVRALLPDLRSPVAADNVDPIPGFQGASPVGTIAEFRRVEPRNTPTIFLADFNFDNFWDGRARHDDNGGSVFGPSDPQSHVFVDDGGRLTPTRQLIKFSSLASLAKGPPLSKFEMSFDGRNWAKVGKKLLQAEVTPLAHQLVSPTDSILGPYSNQNGASSACLNLAIEDRSGSWSGTSVSGKPGLCISYQGLIRQAYDPQLWRNTTWHLDGCFTDGRSDIHPNQCADVGVNVAIPALSGGSVVDSATDPFDSYVLKPASGAPVAVDDPSTPFDERTNQFTQMEANVSLFFGQSIHLWGTILVPDDTPWDQWLDRNPDALFGIGETGEPLLVNDLPNCGTGGTSATLHRDCFFEFGNFKRDSNLTGTDLVTGTGACIASEFNPVVGARVCTTRIPAPGTRVPGSNTPDPLLGMDIFFGSNLSLKNRQFRSARCGECHAPPTLTDHTVPFTHKTDLGDLSPEFERGNPTVEPLLEPLGRPRVISGFLLESEINAPGQDAIERRLINMSIAPAPVVNNNPNCTVDTCSGYSFPDGITNNGNGGYMIHADLANGPLGPGVGVPFTSFGSAFFDNGMYNIGVTRCVAGQAQDSVETCDDTGRGNTDAFGWPLSLGALLMKNLGGSSQEPGEALPTFDPSTDPECAPYCNAGGLWEETAHDQQINSGFDDDEANPRLPPYLAPFVNKINVGDAHPQLDEAGGPPGGMVNTLTDVATTEGFPEFPFNPRNFMSEVINSATATGDGTLDGPGVAQQGTWPVVNRIGRFGSIKAPQLREVELTGPYFHNGGKLTLRQVVDFYVRGGDFPVTNSQHRDFLIVNLNADLQANLSEEEKVALVDFLFELTDSRVAFDRAPFDHPQMIIPLDGKAPEPSASFSRDNMLASCVPSLLAPGGQACAGGMFLDIPAAGSAGNSTRLPSFLNLTNQRLVGVQANCGLAYSQYCH